MVDSHASRLGKLSRAALLAGLLMIGVAAPAAGQGIGLAQLMKITDWGTGNLILFDQLEYAPGGEGGPVALDAIAWYGGAFSRLWVQADAEQLTQGTGGEAEVQLAYGRLVTAYFDALGGLRVDGRWGDASDTRAHLVLGLRGLAPLRFEVSPSLFLSQDGDLSARAVAEYHLLITQKLVAAPRVELNAALQEVPGWGIGTGINDVDLGLRLRYEFRREFAPYVGFAWRRQVGGSAEFARAGGEDVSEGVFVAGLRVWR